MESDSSRAQQERAKEKPEFERRGQLEDGNVPEPKHTEAEPLPPIVPVG